CVETARHKTDAKGITVESRHDHCRASSARSNSSTKRRTSLGSRRLHQEFIAKASAAPIASDSIESFRSTVLAAASAPS
ncbi:MAG TPA: hypothetical protein VH143_08655, partial [Kofleriaceae bacterium]|nr:hypothetical protein [Kofleriaceae bacterium]